MKDRQPSGVGIDVIATIVGLSAILLPAAGYLVRKVALETGLDIDNGTNVALAAPLGLLTITGVYAALSPGLYLLLLPVYHRLALVESAFRRTEPVTARLLSDWDAFTKDLEAFKQDPQTASAGSEGGQPLATEQAEDQIEAMHRRGAEFDERSQRLQADLTALQASEEWRILDEHQREKRWIWTVGELMSKHAPGKVVGRIVNGVLVCAWIGLSLFVLPWPIGVFSFLGWLAVGIVVPWRARRIGRVTPGIAAFSIGWVLLISAIGLGLAGSLPGQAVGDFRFAPAAGMSDGMYVWLGQDNQTAFISPCGTRRLVSVRPDAVEHVVWSRYRDVPQGPTLWEIISRGKQPRYGYRPNC